MTIEIKNGLALLFEFRQYIKSLSDGRYYVTVSSKRPSRTNLQNRYYWSVVVKTLSDELGYTPEEMHDVLRYKFLGTSQVEFSSEKITRINSTTKLNTTEMEDYMSQIRMWASSEMNIQIPLPNETL